MIRGQILKHHPQVHRVAPGAVLHRLVSLGLVRMGLFRPVRVLGLIPREMFFAPPRAALDQGELSFRGEVATLADLGEFPFGRESTRVWSERSGERARPMAGFAVTLTNQWYAKSGHRVPQVSSSMT